MPTQVRSFIPVLLAGIVAAGVSPACAVADSMLIGTHDFYRTEVETLLVVSKSQGVLSNDAGRKGSSNRAVLERGPQHGALALRSSGKFKYAPDNKFFGLDTFTYRMTDGASESAPIKVFIAVHAPCRLEVLDFGPYVDGTPPWEGIEADRVFELLAAVAPFTKGIRTYGMNNGLEVVGPLARQMGFDFIALGAFLDDSEANNDAQVAGLIDAATAGNADLLIVGNEALRAEHPISEAALIDYIEQVKAAMQSEGLDIPVTYSEDVDVLVDYPDVIAACDVLAVNVYPFWRRMTVESAVAYLHCCYSELSETYGKEVIIAETGWPHEGREDAVPVNAKRYLESVVGWARTTGARVFYFEAFDEPWKGSPGSVEVHWGILKPSGKPFPWARRAFRCKPVNDTWSAFCGPGDPELLTTYAPVCGDADDREITGIVWHAPKGMYKIAAYIRVAGRWYSKPREDAPYTPLKCGGAWAVDVGTGQGDELATDIAVFVVPFDYNEPAVSWAEELPPAVYAAAADYAIVPRGPEAPTAKGR